MLKIPEDSSFSVGFLHQTSLVIPAKVDKTEHTSSCLLASSFLMINDNLVRRLRKCISMSMFARFVVTSLIDLNKENTRHQYQIQHKNSEYISMAEVLTKIIS